MVKDNTYFCSFILNTIRIELKLNKRFDFKLEIFRFLRIEYAYNLNRHLNFKLFFYIFTLKEIKSREKKDLILNEAPSQFVNLIISVITFLCDSAISNNEIMKATTATAMT